MAGRVVLQHRDARMHLPRMVVMTAWRSRGMLDWCLAVGIVCVAMAAIMTVIYFVTADEDRGRNAKSAGNIRRKPSPLQRYFDDESLEIELNLDAFRDPDLKVTQEQLSQETRAPEEIILDDEDEVSSDAQNEENAVQKPSLKLASLLEVQHLEALNASLNRPTERPHVLGDEARALGIRYFEYLVSHHVVPRGATHLTNESNIIVAENALKSSRQSATLSHGAVAQRIGERAVCLFEPLTTAVQNVDKSLELISELFASRTVFIVIASTDEVSDDKLAHLGAICKKCHIPKSCLYIEQADGTFFNYIEDMRDYVPSRLNPDYLPKTFFSEMLDYAHKAYDEGDYEAVLRTIEPLMSKLHYRAQVLRNFPKVLVAQALNLMGMTYRDIDRDDDAIVAFTLSLNYLREIEDYEALKSVLANLGITLALAKPLTQPRIELAIRRLNEVTQLNPYDDEAWLYLANSYLELYRMTGAQSLPRRALRAYEKAYDLAANEEVAACIEALQRQIGIRCGYQAPIRHEQPRNSQNVASH